MAFDTVNERLVMVNQLGSPVPTALPEGAASWTSLTACVFLLIYPTSSLAPPVEEEDVEGGSAQVARLKLLGVIN